MKNKQDVFMMLGGVSCAFELIQRANGGGARTLKEELEPSALVGVL